VDGEPQEPVRHRRRRTLIVDRSMQMGAVAAVAGIGAGFVLLWVISRMWSSSPRMGELTGDEASTLAMLADALYIALALAAVVIYVVWLTHRVAGPARVIRHALDGMVANDFGRRLTLRRKDFLKDVAASAANVAAKMRSDRDGVSTLIQELEGLLERSDAASALCVLHSFRDLHALGGAAAFASGSEGTAETTATLDALDALDATTSAPD
jgi:methyl-accepting chemotaxis protein